MPNQFFTTLVTYVLLALAGVISITLPRQLVEEASAAADPQTVRLRGVVRDFQKMNTNLNWAPPGGNGHYAGNVGTTLGPNDQPTFTGGGYKVASEWTDNSGQNMAPNLYIPPSLAEGVDFNITGGSVVPSEAYSAKVSVLGCAMENSFTQMRVTVRLKVGSTNIDPFGSFNSANAGNVHDGNNPRHYITTSTLASGTAMSITGKSWASLNGNHWMGLYTIDSSTNSPMVKVLRNGDSVPDIDPFGDQATIESYLHEYIDQATKTVTIADNQAIFLFELATNNVNSSFCDYQDLVALITMASGPEAFQPGATEPTYVCGVKADDTAGTKGVNSNGGIVSANAFDQWYKDVLGWNLSATHAIELVKNGSGVYEYHNDAFHPVDNMLYGNEGDSHNNYFTYAIDTTFTYNSCTSQFFEFEGADDAWVFVNGQLAIDLGGVVPNTWQRLDMDRLGLTDGNTYTLHLFYAQRNPSVSKFHIRTNIELEGEDTVYAVSAGAD